MKEKLLNQQIYRLTTWKKKKMRRRRRSWTCHDVELYQVFQPIYRPPIGAFVLAWVSSSSIHVPRANEVKPLQAPPHQQQEMLRRLMLPPVLQREIPDPPLLPPLLSRVGQREVKSSPALEIRRCLPGLHDPWRPPGSCKTRQGTVTRKPSAGWPLSFSGALPGLSVFLGISPALSSKTENLKFIFVIYKIN